LLRGLAQKQRACRAWRRARPHAPRRVCGHEAAVAPRRRACWRSRLRENEPVGVRKVDEQPVDDGDAAERREDNDLPALDVVARGVDHQVARLKRFLRLQLSSLGGGGGRSSCCRRRECLQRETRPSAWSRAGHAARARRSGAGRGASRTPVSLLHSEALQHV
jgi:hypothetical protein